MGLPFASGHVLGLRRWTASSVGDAFTSIWHRTPEGRWTFYESNEPSLACSRYFGAGVESRRTDDLRLDWEGPRRLRIRADSADVDWAVDLAETPITRLMSATGSALPLRMWRSQPVLGSMGRIAGAALRVGTVRLTGMTSNGQHFDANPLKVWRVVASTAIVGGVDLGPVGALDTQARVGDFFLPQRGIFAIGRVFVTPLEAESATSVSDVERFEVAEQVVP